jgi:hypothetical protein
MSGSAASSLSTFIVTGSRDLAADTFSQGTDELAPLGLSQPGFRTVLFERKFGAAAKGNTVFIYRNGVIGTGRGTTRINGYENLSETIFLKVLIVCVTIELAVAQETWEPVTLLVYKGIKHRPQGSVVIEIFGFVGRIEVRGLQAVVKMLVKELIIKGNAETVCKQVKFVAITKMTVKVIQLESGIGG